MNKEEIVALLKSNICTVKFEKADGSVRAMLCTLKDEYILVESAGRSKQSDAVVTVWDVEKEDWRAFRLDRLMEGPKVVENYARIV